MGLNYIGRRCHGFGVCGGVLGNFPCGVKVQVHLCAIVTILKISLGCPLWDDLHVNIL
jgi:hypothetical protein